MDKAKLLLTRFDSAGKQTSEARQAIDDSVAGALDRISVIMEDEVNQRRRVSFHFVLSKISTCRRHRRANGRRFGVECKARNFRPS